jgi:hypothetical protein
MTETDFRVKHSELIEYYQLIEERLRGICAELMADDEKNWFNKFRDYELEPFGSLIKKLKDIQGQNQIVLLTEDDFGKLDDLRKARNYWVHQCFGFHNNVTFPGGEVRNPEHERKICADFNEAAEWDEKLTNIVNTRK